MDVPAHRGVLISIRVDRKIGTPCQRKASGASNPFVFDFVSAVYQSTYTNGRVQVAVEENRHDLACFATVLQPSPLT